MALFGGKPQTILQTSLRMLPTLDGSSYIANNATGGNASGIVGQNSWRKRMRPTASDFTGFTRNFETNADVEIPIAFKNPATAIPPLYMTMGVGV